ncbi:hypothetical protein PaG_05684 [Moesziomyces aphidis]|uniref:Uncharacterized protein n=1 Tax=Moesziomyces aphidis TaxID=84754 RepID=W3VF09_MOEAP|nr:hypothetical protein PaG_05684 [Moesziomyces aphidis]
MVVALREQAPKKSRLSLFRLGKATKSAAPSRQDASTPRSYPDASSIPRNSQGDGARLARQTASQGAAPVIAVHYQYPTSTNLPGGYDWPATIESDVDDRRRTRADSLPMQTMFADREARAGKHSRQRSHFSIPDVIVTSCDDDEQHVVEVHVPPNKRRSYVLRDTDASPRSKPSKPSDPHPRRPEPLIRFDSDEMRGMTRTSSVSSLTSPVAESNASTPTSSASSSLSKGSGKRMRKASFPSLFSRKSLDSSRVEEPMPISPVTPSSAPAAPGAFDRRQPDGLLFSAHSGATPGATPLPSPPATPTSPVQKLSKKELKARQKHELALIREVERVDRLVKQHDSKARKAQEKHEAKQRKRQEKLATANAEFHPAPSAPSVAAGRTIFQAATRVTPGLGRRSSTRGFAGERRGSEPTIPSASVEPRAAATPFSIDLPSAARMPFAEPRTAPKPAFAPAYKPIKAPLGTMPTGQSVSPPRPLRPAPPPPQDEPRHQLASWDDLSFAAPLPSLIPASTEINSAAGEEADSVVELDEAARRARRASVQRVLALSDEGGRLHKRGSLRKRTSIQTLKRRSEDDFVKMDKRSGLIPRVGADEGWILQDAAADDSTAVQVDAREWIEDDPDSHSLLQQQGEVDRVLADLHAAQEDHLRRREATTRVADSPPRPARSTRRQEPRSESIDSSDSSGTAITTESASKDVVCFSRPFSPQPALETDSSHDKAFTLELALSPLQPLDIFTTDAHV